MDKLEALKVYSGHPKIIDTLCYFVKCQLNVSSFIMDNPILHGVLEILQCIFSGFQGLVNQLIYHLGLKI